MKEEDKNIKDVFESLAKETKDRAPSFNALWDGAQSTKQRKIRRLKAYSVAASILILLSFGTLFLFQKSDKSDPFNSSNFALLEWKAPTDVLLNNTTSAIGNKIFTMPTDPLLDWQVDDSELLK